MTRDEKITEADFQRILNSFPDEDQEESRTGPRIGASFCCISAGIVLGILCVVMWWHA